jgi:hypothetical protein
MQHKLFFAILPYMTKLLEEAVARVRALPPETQNLAAEAVLMVIQHVNDADEYELTDEQFEGVRHAMGQADRGEFASAREVQEIFRHVL